MAQHPSTAGGEHRGEKTSLLGQDRVPDCVDAAMHTMQTPAAAATFDRVLAESHLEQLPARNDSVLPFCEIRDLPIRAASPPQPVYMTG